MLGSGLPGATQVHPRSLPAAHQHSRAHGAPYVPCVIFPPIIQSGDASGSSFPIEAGRLGSAADCRDGRPTEAPLGRTRCVRCIGRTSARVSSRSEGAQPPSLSQRGVTSGQGSVTRRLRAREAALCSGPRKRARRSCPSTSTASAPTTSSAGCDGRELPQQQVLNRRRGRGAPRGRGASRHGSARRDLRLLTGRPLGNTRQEPRRWVRGTVRARCPSRNL
jgi:hypothetical protein